jgi:hypothetical protein
MQNTRIQNKGLKHVLCLLACLWLSLSVCVSQRVCLLDTALSYVGVRELTGNNDGPEVEKFLASVGFSKGFPWCAGFTTYVYESCGVKNPKSAWSPNWALDKDMIWNHTMSPRIAMTRAKPADAFTIYYESLGRVGHVGLIYYTTPTHLYTIEGNTNADGSREGNGCFIKKRPWRSIYRITSYVN